MKEIWKKYKIWITIGAFLIIIALLFCLAFVYLVKDIETKSDDIQEKIIDNEINQKKFLEISEMEKTYNKSKEREANLNIILRKESEVDFIKKLENIAEETGNEINLSIEENLNSNTSKKNLEGEKKNEIKIPYENYILVQIETIGSYTGFINFLNKLENLDNFINILSVNAKVAKNSPAGLNNDSFLMSYSAGRSETTESLETRFLKSQIDLIVYIEK